MFLSVLRSSPEVRPKPETIEVYFDKCIWIIGQLHLLYKTIINQRLSHTTLFSVVKSKNN